MHLIYDMTQMSPLPASASKWHLGSESFENRSLESFSRVSNRVDTISMHASGCRTRHSHSRLFGVAEKSPLAPQPVNVAKTKPFERTKGESLRGMEGA